MHLAALALTALAASPSRPMLVEGRRTFEQRCAACHDEALLWSVDALHAHLETHPDPPVDPAERWNVAWYARAVDRPEGRAEVARALLWESLRAYMEREPDVALELAERAHRDGLAPITPGLVRRPDLGAALAAQSRSYRATLANGSNVARAGLELRTLSATLDEATTALGDGPPSGTEVMRHVGLAVSAIGAPAALWMGMVVASARAAESGRRQWLAGLAGALIVGALWPGLDHALALRDQLPWGPWFVAISQLVGTCLAVAWWGRARRGAAQGVAVLGLATVPWLAPAVAGSWALLGPWFRALPVATLAVAGAALASLAAGASLLGATTRHATAGRLALPIASAVLAAVAAGRAIVAFQSGGWLPRTPMFGPEIAFLAVHRTVEGYAAELTALAVGLGLAWWAARPSNKPARTTR